MAYAAVISLKRTFKRLLNSSYISLVSSSREIIEFAYNEAESLQEVLKRLDDISGGGGGSGSKRLDALDGQMREEVHKVEDLIECLVSDQFLSQCKSHGDDEGSCRTLSLDLEEVREEIESFAESMKKMKEGYIKELVNSSPEGEEDDADIDGAISSSSVNSGVEMVGLSDEFLDIKHQMLLPVRPDDFYLFLIVGMKGSGRTSFAWSIYEDLYINGGKQYFDCGAWVTIGPNYQFREILQSIIAQIDDHRGRNAKLVIREGGEDIARQYLYRRLEGRRYMVVLDDICDTETFQYLGRSFPVQDNGSLVLFTSSAEGIQALLAGSCYLYECHAYSEDFCLTFLRLVVFGIESLIPPELEEAAKKIVGNCGGRLIPLVKLLLFLREAEKTPEYWNKMAADKDNSIFMVADEISEDRKIKEDVQQLRDLFQDNDDDEMKLAISTLDASTNNSRSVKLLKRKMFPERIFPKMEVMSFTGMAGIGKTTFVKKIVEDPLIFGHFDHHAWITLGPKYHSVHILVDVLAQIYPDIDKMHMKRDANLVKDLCAQLSNKRCLIALDDVWNEEPLHCLKRLFPEIKGRALVTTRQAKAAHLDKFGSVHEMRLLNKEESWSLLCQKVFCEELCPPKLEKAGKKIADNCEGLPLTIITVANILSKVEKSLEYWNKAAEKKSSLFMNAYNEMSNALLPSYKCMPQHLKASILYMGVFPQEYKIPTSKLIKLWIAEGFLEPNPSQTIEDFAIECLLELVDRSLVMVCQKSSTFGVKTCRLHSVFWYLLNNEAMENKFFHAFNTYVDNSTNGIRNHRRLSIRNGILFSIKDVYNSVASISTAHSLLCTGPPHQYPVPIYFGLRLLRILDAFTIRFYEFPIEVVKLIHLTYLALTCNDKLPACISKLWNLEDLIVGQHMNIKNHEDASYLPIEIWDMKELKHLQIMGRTLPNPNSGALLPNLLTLLDVSVHICTERVLKAIPNLKRLGIRIELTPDDDGKQFHFLDHISLLHKLESLECVVVNPELKYVTAPAPRSIFPWGLKELSLSGLGYPWEYMSIIGKLKNLEVLKLQCYAFRGPEWKIDDGDFSKLKFLLIEDTDLVRWKRAIASFLVFKHLSIKHCHKIKELPWDLGLRIEMIEVVDCNPLVVYWAKQMQEKEVVNPFGRDTRLKAHIHSTWDVGNHKTEESEQENSRVS